MKEESEQKDTLFGKVSLLIEQSRRHEGTAADTAMVYASYGIGRCIAECEQDSLQGAEHGKTTLRDLSKRLTDKYGKDWTVNTLKKCRVFFLMYSNTATTARNSQKGSNATPAFPLSWPHYLVLMRIEDPDERSFYETECRNQNWSARQLQRQYNSSLYERLALSRDNDELLKAKMKEFFEKIEQHEK